eukprot:3186605-Rhodomonas_salina.1
MALAFWMHQGLLPRQYPGTRSRSRKSLKLLGQWAPAPARSICTLNCYPALPGKKGFFCSNCAAWLTTRPPLRQHCTAAAAAR